MGITWETPFTLVNLYLIWNQTVGEAIGHQKQIGSRYQLQIMFCKRADPEIQREYLETRHNGMSTAALMVPIPAAEAPLENLLY